MYRQHPTVYLGALRGRTASRKLATTPGQSGTSQTQPGGSNRLIFLSALGALGGLYYYYYSRGQPAVDRETARHKEEETEKKVKEIGEVGSNRVESAAKQVQRDYSQRKAIMQDAATTARADLTERARESAHEAQAKLDGLKDAAEQRISDVRDRSKKYEEEVAHQAHDAKDKVRGWFGWW